MRTLLIGWCCCLAMMVGITPSIAQGPVKLAEPLSPYYLLGTSVPIPFDYTAQASAPLQLDDFGIPVGLKCVLLGPDGTPVSRASWGKPPNTPFIEPFILKKGATVRLSVDVAEVFGLLEAGHYRLQLGDTDNPLTLLASTLVSKAEVTNVCTMPPTVKRSTTFGLVVSITAQIRKTDTKPEHWAIMLEYPRIANLPWGWGWEQSFIPFYVPANTRIIQIELDYKGELWAHLEAQGKHCLLVWDLVRDRVTTPIAWSKTPVEMGSIHIASRSYDRIIVAGTAGKVLFSSLSY